ncbi:MAG: hypothetical protein AB1556_12085 [Bacillota bacterium]
MVRKVLKLVSLLALLAYALSAGAYALFSYQAETAGSSLVSGTLYIGKDENNKGVLDGLISLKKLVPGAPEEKITLPVKNIGTLTACLNGLAANIQDTQSKFLANALWVTCSGPGGERLYRGSLLSLDGNAVPTEKEVVLQPGETGWLTFAFRLDPRAGNWYKGKKIDFSIVVYAGQNPGQALQTNVKIAGAGKDVRALLEEAKPRDVILLPAGEYGRLRLETSGVVLKAKDVVFDTVISGLAIGKNGAPGGEQPRDVAVVGFTLDGEGGPEPVLTLPPAPQNIWITDNIFKNSPATVPALFSARIFGRAANLEITRNDFTGINNDPGSTALVRDAPVPFKPLKFSPGAGATVRYNLGIDLDPAVEAL